MPGVDPTPQTWAAALLRRLKIHQTPGAVQGLTGWANAEGGNWHNDAHYNPLNTTQNAPGAGNTGTQGNIKSYKDWGQGLDATVQTLKNGRYGSILHALGSGDPNALAAAIGQTPWGTSGDLVRQTIASTPRVAGVHAFDVPGSTQAPASSNVSRIVASQVGVPGASQVAPTKPSVYDVIASYRNATQPQTPTPPSDGVQDPYDPVASGLKIQDTVARIQAIRGQTQQAFQTGDAHAAGVSGNPDAPTALKQIIEEADRINTAKLPYVYGGGHTAANKRGGALMPLDCSATVSRVLGINTRVSGELAKWGEAGHGQHVTIYANPEHTLMEIDGRFFGTSGSNPGGGAGWIDRKAISPGYLKNFTVRHPKGM